MRFLVFIFNSLFRTKASWVSYGSYIKFASSYRYSFFKILFQYSRFRTQFVHFYPLHSHFISFFLWTFLHISSVFQPSFLRRTISFFQSFHRMQLEISRQWRSWWDSNGKLSHIFQKLLYKFELVEYNWLSE